ncbi:MAG TPA: helix-turn-helix transcriptional regulator [Gemmatimonadales bacterium]|jgi:DNA-binding transcriptional ArsR family regulator
MIACLDTDEAVVTIAAAIGEPARARMLYTLLDDRARTSTELATVAGVTPSTASVHLAKLRDAALVTVVAQGKHRFYRLAGPDVAGVLERLSTIAGNGRGDFVPSTPDRLRSARSCYDHLAGTVGVLLYDRFVELGWIAALTTADGNQCDVTVHGVRAFGVLGIDVEATRALRRQFAVPCLDWSERRSHLGGAMGAAFMALALRKRWIAQERHGRAVQVTTLGRRALRGELGLVIS